MKLVRFGRYDSLSDRGRHWLSSLLMGLDCLISVLTLTIVDTRLAAPIIKKQMDKQDAQRKATMEKIAKQIGDALKQHIAKAEAEIEAEIVDWESIAGRPVDKTKDN